MNSWERLARLEDMLAEEENGERPSVRLLKVALVLDLAEQAEECGILDIDTEHKSIKLKADAFDYFFPGGKWFVTDDGTYRMKHEHKEGWDFYCSEQAEAGETFKAGDEDGEG